ncbi:MAG: DUF3108 domain-containing protein [Pyrinomonadaceae bacterium]
MKIKIAVWLCLIICVVFSAADTQMTAKNDAFSAGEVLKYEARLRRSLVGGMSLGGADLTFTTARAPNGKDYLFLTEVVSKGNLLKLFRYKFLEKYESTVDGDKFRILKTVKHDEQGSRIRDGEAIFDYRSKQVVYTEINPEDTARPPRRIASAIQDDTLDLVSAIYNLRRLPLAVGKTFELSVSDSGLVYKIPVRVTAREPQNSILGKVWCFRLEPEVFGTNRLIEENGKMTLWITEDSRRIPVRAEIFASVGKIDVKLEKNTSK